MNAYVTEFPAKCQSRIECLVRLQYDYAKRICRTSFPRRVKPNPDRLDLTIYPHRVELQTRFSDIDPQWHLNNVRIAEFYQEARISFNRALSREFALEHVRDRRVLVARQSIDYLGEVKWPALITIGVGVANVGGASFSLALGMFHDGKCVGISDAVLVYATQAGPTRIPEALREVLGRKLLPASAR
jgi:acyl-CoA thioester hydrolase